MPVVLREAAPSLEVRREVEPRKGKEEADQRTPQILSQGRSLYLVPGTLLVVMVGL